MSEQRLPVQYGAGAHAQGRYGRCNPFMSNEFSASSHWTPAGLRS